MKGQMLRRARVLRRVTHLTAASLAIVAMGAASGCLTRPLQQEDTRTTSTVVTRLKETGVDKIDLLLMIDNSRSMADKQQVLVEAIPDLVKGLVNPKCVDENDPYDATLWSYPASPTEACAPGKKRDFNPVLDIHIGIVTSSIGGHGSDSCPNEDTTSGSCPGETNRTNNDMGHLVARTSPCSSNAAPTYQGHGFLAWDPSEKYDPPGETAVGEIAATVDANGNVATITPGLVPSLKDMVLGTGQIGCGYESQMESWYRFLVDPTPYTSITIDAKGRATAQGSDDVLLQQRKDFLRPGSLLAIIGLTDENDCSVKEFGQFWFVNQQRDPNNKNKNFYLPKPRPECATNPNDPCCRSCGMDQTGCPDASAACAGSLDAKTDDVNLRCWDTKRRFGIDFLYPIDRYVTGLTSGKVPDRSGNLVDNPIFSVLDKESTDTTVRDQGLVFLAYIVGVPWQDIARQDKDGKPDLLSGLDPEGNPVGGFMSGTELALKNKGPTQDKSMWDYIVGDPKNYVKPLDPHMIESNAPRSGSNPITGDTLTPPNKNAGEGADKINGHEYTPGTVAGVQSVADDLQYACIFELQNPRDCKNASTPCDCKDAQNDNPLCEPTDPSNPTTTRTRQVRAKAYPGIRELQLVQALGAQGIVGSICPVQMNNPKGPDFGYRPAIGSIIDRLKKALGNTCLPRKLTPDHNGQVQCLILEGHATGGTHAKDCNDYCDGKTAEKLVARQHVQTGTGSEPNHQEAVVQAKEQSGNQSFDCFCEIKQLAGTTTPNCTDAITPQSELDACQCISGTANPTYNGAPVNGWCYVDATAVPPVGNEQIVSKCSETERRLVRFVGGGSQLPATELFITCTGE